MEIRGELWGRRAADGKGGRPGEIVRIATEHRPDGPAENAWLLIDYTPDGARRARYVSWINYYDIEFANQEEPGRWETVEPPQPYETNARWQPFGWSEPLPNTARVK